ncbi:MAG: hypothetical protein ACRDBM_13585 [Sporomusa sp.]
MSSSTCPECSSDIPSENEACPQCGYNTVSEKAPKKTPDDQSDVMSKAETRKLIIVIAAITVIFFAAVIFVSNL